MKRRSGLVLAAFAVAAMALGSIDSGAQAARTPGATRTKVSARDRVAGARDTVLARVGRETITRAGVQARINELPEPYRTNYSTPDGRRQLLDRMIEERVWLLGARKKGIPERPEVRRQLEASERDLVIRTYVTEVMAANPAPSDSEAHAYYNEHLTEYRQPASVTLSHIQLKTEADARRVKALAKSGQDWPKLVTRFSTDSLTRASGGSLGTVTREGIFGPLGAQPALAESAFALGSRAIGGPYRTPHGWHVIKVDTVRAEVTRPFEQLRSRIVQQLGQTHAQTYYRQRLAEEKASLGFSEDTTAIRAYVSQRESAQELFRKAQESGAPAARVAAYGRVVEEYPDSNVSPQAQFMIGFIYSEELKNYDEADKAFRQLLSRYPKSELAESARWMLEHMRTEEAPTFMNLEADSSAHASPAAGAKRRSAKP